MAPAKKSTAPVGWEPVEEQPAGWEAVDTPAENTPQQPTASFSAQPASKTPVQDWLRDLETDIRSGGTRTIVGRTMGNMEGRGDKGYAGLQQGGQPKAVIDFMASPVLGATHAAQGTAATVADEADTAKHGLTGSPQNSTAWERLKRGPLKTAGGVLEMGTIPGMVVGGPAAEAAITAVPSREFAAQLFKDVSEHAGNVPVSITHSGDAILRAQEISNAGTSMPQSLGKLLKRVTDPKKAPLTYDEARDFYTNITSLSANESARLSPVMRKQVANVRAGLMKDIGDAADQAGQAAKYYAAMKDYARASKLLRASQKIGKFALGAAGLGSAYEGYQAVKGLTK
jgi:hypothetical protein